MARILVPFTGGAASTRAMDAACHMAAESGDEVWAVYVIRVPWHLPILHAYLAPEHGRAERVLEQACVIAHRHHICPVTIMVEAHHVGQGIVEIARECDLVILGQSHRRYHPLRMLSGRVQRYVKTHAPCRLLILPALAPARSGAPAFAPLDTLQDRVENA